MKQEIETSQSPPNVFATTPEGLENECISLAYNLVAERLRNGTATSAETVHFLKLGSSKERIEKESMRKDIALKDAKREALESAKHIEELYNNAIRMMRVYGGYGDE